MEQETEPPNLNNAQSTYGFAGHQILRLCKRYVTEIHHRNPVLDEAELLLYATEIAEHGLDWSPRSCLVLLACAVVALTAPWEVMGTTPSSVRSSAALPEDEIQTAEIYFYAARQRIGLLGTSILDIPCLFLAFIYEKCCLRILRSWQYLEQASSRLQMFIARRRRHYELHGEDNTEVQPTVHRLFASCVKAEWYVLAKFDLCNRC